MTTDRMYPASLSCAVTRSKSARKNPVWFKSEYYSRVLDIMRCVEESHGNPIAYVTRRSRGCATLVFADGAEDTVCFRRSNTARTTAR